MQLPPSCTLDDAGEHEQRVRYARLAKAVERVLRKPEAIEIDFDRDLDLQLLEETLAVERECCPFFQFEFDGHQRRLRVTVTDAEMLPALDAIAHGFGAG
jgi:hypothetical protein